MAARQSTTARAFTLAPIQKHTLYIGLTVLMLVAWVQPAAAAVNLVLAPTSLSFVAVQGNNPLPQTVNAYPSVAGTAISPTFSSSVNWIALFGANAGDQSLVLGVGNIIAPPLPLAVH
jgi:hypothetical protein